MRNVLKDLALRATDDVEIVFFGSIIDWILGRALQDYPGAQVGANIHVSDLTYVVDIVILSSSYREMQGLFEGDNSNAAAVSKRINASKTKPSCLTGPFSPA